MDGKEEDIKPCINCHNGCFTMCRHGNSSNDQDLGDAIHMARCALTPPTMQSKKYKLVKTQKAKSVAIIGGGIGGMESALVLAERGHRPVIYEKGNSLGGVFVKAASFSFKEHDRALIEWYKREIAKSKIEVNFNTEIKDPSTLKEDEIIIATGATANRPPIKGLQYAIEATEFLAGKEVKENVIIIGGGLTGCEIAYELVLKGKKPTIVEMKDDLVAVKGVCLANSSFLREMLAFKKVPVYLNTTLLEITKDSVKVKDKEGKEFELKGDNTITSLGYHPNPLAPKSGKIYLVGDANGVGNLRTVIWRAWDVGMKI